jgi:hypothetical protein
MAVYARGSNSAGINGNSSRKGATTQKKKCGTAALGGSHQNMVRGTHPPLKS